MSQSQAMRVLTSHASAEWYTPPHYVNLAREVLGGIDLDPASSPTAQTWIQAARYFTEADDGLSHEYHGRVWLNPPYGVERGKSRQALWAEKLEAEYLAGRVAAAVLLVNSTHGYSWYERLWSRWPVCLAQHRICFLRPDGTSGGPAKRGQTFVYFGPNVARFMSVFGCVGRVLRPDTLTYPDAAPAR